MKRLVAILLFLSMSGCVTSRYAQEYAELRYLQGRVDVYKETEQMFEKLDYCEPRPTQKIESLDEYFQRLAEETANKVRVKP